MRRPSGRRLVRPPAARRRLLALARCWRDSATTVRHIACCRRLWWRQRGAKQRIRRRLHRPPLSLSLPPPSLPPLQVRTLVENGVATRQRSMFVIVGDKARDQVRIVGKKRGGGGREEKGRGPVFTHSFFFPLLLTHRSSTCTTYCPRRAFQPARPCCGATKRSCTFPRTAPSARGNSKRWRRAGCWTRTRRTRFRCLWQGEFRKIGGP